MDLEKIEILKNFFKFPDFATLKHLIFIILWYQSSSSRSQAELLTISWMKRCFEKNGAAKDFDFKQKKSIWKKKIRDHLELRALAFNSGWSPIFWPPEKFHIMSVILSSCLFPVINP